MVGSSAEFSVAVSDGVSPPLPSVNSGTLQLWLEAGAGVSTNASGQVTLWQDQSGNTNDASQATTNNQPSLVYPPSLGGNAAVRFNGIQDNLNGSYLFASGDVDVPNAMASFVVYNAFSTTNADNVLWLLGVPGGDYGAVRGDDIHVEDLLFSTWAYDYPFPFLVPTNTYRIWTAMLDTNLSTLQVGDISATSATNFSTSLANVLSPAAGYYVGGLNPSVGYTSVSRCFDGDIAELIIYSGELAQADQLAVQEYLEQKYYITTAPSGVTFQWQLNETNIPGATNSILTLTNVQTNAAGSYSVIVTDPKGSTNSANAVLTVNLPPPCAPVPAGLVAWWTADGNADDIVSTNNGILENGVTFAPGEAGLAFSFNGEDQYVQIADSPSLEPESVSLECWFNASNDVGTANLISKPVGPGTLDSYQILFLDGDISGVVSNPNTEGPILSYPFPPVPGVWYHTALVPLQLLSAGNENSLYFSLDYSNAVLTYTGATLGSNAAGAILIDDRSQTNSGRVGLELELPGSATFSIGTQQVAVLTFAVGLLTNEVVTPINFGSQPTAEEVFNAQFTDLPATYSSGTVSIAATAVEGDVFPRSNGNGIVLLNDWFQEGRFVAGLDTFSNASEFQRADCAPRATSGDGLITVADWVQVGRYAAGFDPPTYVSNRTFTGTISNTPSASRILSLASVGQGQLTNTLTLQLAAQGGENALSCSVAFDPASLGFLGATLGAAAAGAVLEVNTNQAAAGELGLAVALPPGSAIPSGLQSLVKLNFLSIGYSNTVPLVLGDVPVPRQVADTNASILQVSFQNGSLAVAGLSWPLLSVSQSGTNVVLAWPVANWAPSKTST